MVVAVTNAILASERENPEVNDINVFSFNLGLFILHFLELRA